jgi:hypothetical protein
MSKTSILTYLLCVSPFFAIAQSVSGFWKGTLDMVGGCFAVNNIELQITINGHEISGNSYHYFDINNYVKKKFTGSYDSALKKIYLQEAIVTTYKIPQQCQVCIKRYELNYSGNVSEEALKGDWSSVISPDYPACETGTIKLSRVRESAFKEIPEILVDTGQIRLDFYDNGEIDGDSIAVRINDRIVLSHQRLSAEPITTFVKIDLNNKFQEVEMIAENMGTIPPNTALLIITAGKKRYELFMTSTNQKSAKVRFLYEK